MESTNLKQTYYGFILVKTSNGTICGRFPLTKKECTLGRDDKCDIRIILENVSGHHCSIFYIDDKVKIKQFSSIFNFIRKLLILIFKAYVRDKSLAGSTKVNGKKVGRNNFLLHHRDEIGICGRKFIWEYAKSYP